MAPGNKTKTFTGSALSKSGSEIQNSGSETKKKKKRLRKSAHGKKLTESEPLRCYSPLVYDPEVSLRELMQKYEKQPESYKISDLREYETNVTPQGIVRMGVSNHISRFEIPMDVKQLEDMTVHEYLRSYCWVCKRRQIYYKKFFDKFDKDKDGLLSIKEMERALNDLYFDEIDSRHMEELMALTREGKEVFDTRLFFSVCALSERMFYSRFVTEDMIETYSEKQWVETADFFALSWKFEGCNINTSLKKLFSILYPDLAV
ncbi:uncharacterized protein LOC142741432 [Rhinoderma darwinii]|uniref:uncharacterized protein LOC142741432 n=1 Tax=Rhinoderma darwinii TaxID=43563 RepID=UPI003F661462